MNSQKRKHLESTVTALQRRYGRRALQTGRELAQAPPPPHISTGFPQLDTLTGCGGVPRRFWFDASWTLHQAAALHVELRHERWLTTADRLLGYEVQAQVRKSRWARPGGSTTLAITFNGAVQARPTW